MEAQMDMKGLNKNCACGSNILAGNCCRKDETCPCGSGDKVNDCCLRPMTETVIKVPENEPNK